MHPFLTNTVRTPERLGWSLFAAILTLLMPLGQQPHAIGQQPPPSPPNVEVHWHGGDRISGSLESLHGNLLSLRSRVFNEVVGLDPKGIRSVHFLAGPSPKGKAKHHLLLANGSHLFADWIGIDGEYVMIREPLWGEAKLPRHQVVFIESLDGTHYQWNGVLDDWKSPAASTLQGWNVDPSGSLVARQGIAKAWLPLPLEGSFSVEISLASNQRLDFAFALGEEVDASLRLATIDAHLILGTADDFEVVKTLEDHDKEWSGMLEWNAESQTFTLMAPDRKVIASVKETSASPRTGVLLINQGNTLDVRQLRVTRGRALPSRLASLDAVPSDRLVRWDGTVFEEPIQGLKDGMLSVASSPNAPLLIADVARLDLQGTMLTKANSSNAHCLRYQLGSELWCDAIEIDQGKVVVKAPYFNNPVTLPLTGLESIRFRDDGWKPKPPSATLRLGEYRIQGEFQWGTTESPFIWTSQGQATPVGIATRLPVEIDITHGGERILSSQFPDIVYLKNGDVLPCTLESIREKGATLATAFSGSRFVSSHQLRAIELQRSGERLKHSFTKESREQLLTIPRTMDTSLYRHAVLAKNGDLLRGNVLRLQGGRLEVESKQEPFLISKEIVQGIVFLEDPKPVLKADSPDLEATVSDSETTMKAPVISLSFLDSFMLTGTLAAQDADFIEIDSMALGRCRVPRSSIVSALQGGLDPETTSNSYTPWKLQSTIAPRWKAADQSPEEASTLVGTRVTPFELAGIDGKTFRFAEHAGKIIVLDFWASSCGPCVMAIPEYLRVMSEFSSQDVLFLGVNGMETPESIRSFLRKKSWEHFPTLLDFDGELARAMKVQGIPHTVIIGPDGVIRHVHVGYSPGNESQLRDKVKSLLDSH